MNTQEHYFKLYSDAVINFHLHPTEENKLAAVHLFEVFLDFFLGRIPPKKGMH